jgi:hypothetical protein
MHMLIRVICLLFVTLSLFGQSVDTAQVTPLTQVQGMKGLIDVLPTPERNETVIDFQPTDRANHLVFVVQYADQAKPLARWTGSGKLFLTDGVLASLGDDGTK